MKKIVYCVCAVVVGCCFALPALAETGRSIERIEKTFNNYDENKNGKVTQKEFLSFWESKFKATDRNDDGVLDQTEVLHARGFQARDANKDGVIELHEDLSMRKRHWNRHRLGNNGWLSLDDYVRHVRGLPARSDYDLETTFTKMDANHNGMLTEDEYLAFWDEYFTNRDADEDDKLSRKEHRQEDSFSSFDANRNDSIEREEDVLIRKKDFKGLDLDDDGALTQSEFVR